MEAVGSLRVNNSGSKKVKIRVIKSRNCLIRYPVLSAGLDGV